MVHDSSLIDILTGLYNNYAFRLKITSLIEHHIPFVTTMFGIDNFKHINDFYSYSLGDKVLNYFSNKLITIMGAEVELFRLDGDGFAFIKTGTDTSFCINKFQEIQKIANIKTQINEASISFSISGGICSYPENGTNCDEIYCNARMALAKAKSGENQKYVCYNEKLTKDVRMEMLLFNELQFSVQNNFSGFSLNYQPIMRSVDHTIDGCEALLRWFSPIFPEGITPDRFIPILEKSGLILDVGKFVIETAFRQCALWNKTMPSFNMNVNVAACQFDQEDFTGFVLEMLSKYNLPANVITLELTESQKADFASISHSFSFLRKHGIKTAFDDFGTGYASVDIFRSISADELKIDQSFLKELTYNVIDQIVLMGIIDMCKSMNMMVCVEGVETSEIENILSPMGPLLLQGYYYSKPINADDFEQKYICMNNNEIINTLGTSIQQLRPTRPLSYEESINDVNIGIIQIAMDTNGTFLAFNNGFRRMCGYSIFDIENKFKNSALAMIHGDDIERVLDELHSQLSKNEHITTNYRLMRSDGSYIWIIATGTLVKGSDGINSMLVALVNLDSYKIAEINDKNSSIYSPNITNNVSIEKIYLKSNQINLERAHSINKQCECLINIESKIDSITGLWNKSTLNEKIHEEIMISKPKKYAILMLDIDNFKDVNTSYGDFIGDKVLNIISNRLQGIFRAKDIIGRSGGDEFIVYMQYDENYDDDDELFLKERETKILESTRSPIYINENLLLTVHTSIGISLYPKHGKTCSELLLQASNALYRAKKNGKNCCIIA